MSLWVASALLALGASVRLTRLVTVDKVAFPLRRWAAAKGPPGLGAWLSCPWCVGFWITLVCVAVQWFAVPLAGVPWWYAIPAEALTFAYVVGMIADLEVAAE